MVNNDVKRKNKAFMAKPENYYFYVPLLILGVIVLCLLWIFWPQITNSLKDIIDTLSFLTVSMLGAVLSILEIKKLLNNHFKKKKFYIERIGIFRDYYFYIAVHNKTKEVALNCRVKGVFKDFYSYDLVWKDPAHPKYYDVPVEEYAYLFFLNNSKEFRLPLSSIHPHFVNKDLQIASDKKKTFWTYERDDRLYKEFQDYELTIIISAENANTYQETFIKLSELIKKIKESKNEVILKKDFQETGIILDKKIKID